MTIPILSLLAFVGWTLGLVIFGIGSIRVGKIMAGKAAPNAFPADVAHGTEGYRRLLRAHMNCVENLPVFGALVLSAAVMAVQGETLDLLCITVVVARVGQSIAHVASGRNLAVHFRFLFYCVQLACFVWIGSMVARAALA